MAADPTALADTSVAAHPFPRHFTRRAAAAHEAAQRQLLETDKQRKAREVLERRQERLAHNIQLHPPRQHSTRRQQRSDEVKVGRQRRKKRDREAELTQLQDEKEAEEAKEQEPDVRSHVSRPRRVSRWSSESRPASSVVVSRRLADYRRARVLIVGAGPAALAAACQLSDEGYYDVVMVEARDRIGGRVHTIDLQRLVQQQMRMAQQTADAESEARLRQLLACPQLGVVDEGAAFVHGYNSRNRVTNYIPAQHTHPKSEHREQWREHGRALDVEKVNEARRLYAYIDHTVLHTLTEEVYGPHKGNSGDAHDERSEEEAAERGEEDNSNHTTGERTEDVSVRECFDSALAALLDRKRRRWRTDVDGEEEDEKWIREQEENTSGGGLKKSAKNRGKRKRDETRQWLPLREADASPTDVDVERVGGANGVTAAVADEPAVSLRLLPASHLCSPRPRWTIADRECDLELKKRILAGVRVSQHCYVAEDSQLSAFDLLHCVREPPLSHPEVIPLLGYSELIDAMVDKLQQWRRDFCPQLNTRVVAIEEKTVYGTTHSGTAREEHKQNNCSVGTGDDKEQQVGSRRRGKATGVMDEHKASGAGSECAYVEVTVMSKGEDGLERQETLFADYCIVTVPLGVLKHPSQPVRFIPPLSAVFPLSTDSASRQDCIDGLAMGCENKVILCWAEQWWNRYIDPATPASAADGATIAAKDERSVQYFRSTAHPYIKVLILPNMRTSQHTLVMHFAPPDAYRIGDMSSMDATKEAMRILRDMFEASASIGSTMFAVPEPDLAYVSRWHSDPCCFGSYSYVPVGGSNHSSTLLAERSAHSRLLFAGEHCAGSDLQTVHGALVSGEMAAKQVRLMVQANGVREAEHRVCRLSAQVASKSSVEMNSRSQQDISAKAKDSQAERAATMECAADESEHTPLEQAHVEQKLAPDTPHSCVAEMRACEADEDEAVEVSDERKVVGHAADTIEASDSHSELMECSRAMDRGVESLGDNDATSSDVSRSTNNYTSPLISLHAQLDEPASAVPSVTSSSSGSTRNSWLQDMDAEQERHGTSPDTSSGKHQQRRARAMGRRGVPVPGGSQPNWTAAYQQLPLQHQQSVRA